MSGKCSTPCALPASGPRAASATFARRRAAAIGSRMSDAHSAGHPVIGVLISGRGSNLQALIDAIAEGRLGARIGVVISNRADAAGLDRARAAGIESLVV